MTEIPAAAVPMNPAERNAEHPALQSLDLPQLQKLWSVSRSIRSLGLFWGFSGIVTTYLGWGMMAAQGDKTPLGLFLALYGVAFTVLGPYSAWARPSWGRWVCMVLSIPPLAKVPYGTLLGILSLVALVKAEPLFSDNKVSHQELEAALKARRR